MKITGKKYKMLKRNTYRFFKEFDNFTDTVEKQLPGDFAKEDDVWTTIYDIIDAIISQFPDYDIHVRDMFIYKNGSRREPVHVAYVDIYVDNIGPKTGIFTLLPEIKYRKMIFSKKLDIHFTIGT